MTPLLMTLLIVTGACVAGGSVAVLAGLQKTPPALTDALALLAGHQEVTAQKTTPTSRLDRIGAWLARHSPIPILPTQRRALELQRRSVAEFHADKFVWLIIGCVLPTFMTMCLAVALGPGPQPTALFASLCGILGWFVPDFLLARRQKHDKVDANDALFTFLDLVILERLANRSLPQALASAAAQSDQPLFVHLRQALERAELQQQPPHHELAALADRLELPALADVADTVRLDETGAALTEALRARVLDLRDAHLAAQRVEAHAVSERMTLAMTAPVLVFAAILLAAPLLRLTQT